MLSTGNVCVDRPANFRLHSSRHGARNPNGSSSVPFRQIRRHNHISPPKNGADKKISLSRARRKNSAIKSALTVIIRRPIRVNVVSAIATVGSPPEKGEAEKFTAAFLLRVRDIGGRRKKENRGRGERSLGIPFPYPRDENCEQKLIPMNGREIVDLVEMFEWAKGSTLLLYFVFRSRDISQNMERTWSRLLAPLMAEVKMNSLFFVEERNVLLSLIITLCFDWWPTHSHNTTSCRDLKNYVNFQSFVLVQPLNLLQSSVSV